MKSFYLLLTLSYQTVVEILPLVLVSDERLSDVLEPWQFIQATDFIPRLRWKPSRWVAVWVVQSNATC